MPPRDPTPAETTLVVELEHALGGKSGTPLQDARDIVLAMRAVIEEQTAPLALAVGKLAVKGGKVETKPAAKWLAYAFGGGLEGEVALPERETCMLYIESSDQLAGLHLWFSGNAGDGHISREKLEHLHEVIGRYLATGRLEP